MYVKRNQIESLPARSLFFLSCPFWPLPLCPAPHSHPPLPLRAKGPVLPKDNFLGKKIARENDEFG